MTEVFFSLDIETDGPTPIKNSMLSFGCAAFLEDGTLLGTFERNLLPFPGATEDPSTMKEFWAKETEAWNHCMQNRVDPAVALFDFAAWVESFNEHGSPVAVCAPSGFDFTFLYMYLNVYYLRNPFGFSCIDIRTFLSSMKKIPYKKAGKKAFEGRWFDRDLPHTHKALDDALEQGLAFVKMRAEHLAEEGQDKEALCKKIRSTFWNSRGGKPGTVIVFNNGNGKIEVGSERLTFYRRHVDAIPDQGSSVSVLLNDAGEIIKVVPR